MGILDCKIDERPAPWIWSCRRKKVNRNDHSYARILQESVYSAYVRKIPFFVLIGYIYDPISEWEYGVCWMRGSWISLFLIYKRSWNKHINKEKNYTSLHRLMTYFLCCNVLLTTIKHTSVDKWMHIRLQRALACSELKVNIEWPYKSATICNTAEV